MCSLGVEHVPRLARRQVQGKSQDEGKSVFEEIINQTNKVGRRKTEKGGNRFPTPHRQVVTIVVQVLLCVCV